MLLYNVVLILEDIAILFRLAASFFFYILNVRLKLLAMHLSVGIPISSVNQTVHSLTCNSSDRVHNACVASCTN